MLAEEFKNLHSLELIRRTQEAIAKSQELILRTQELIEFAQERTSGEPAQKPFILPKK